MNRQLELGKFSNELFVGVVKAITSDVHGHFPKCGWTPEDQACSCAAMGDRIRLAIKAVLAAHEVDLFPETK